MVRSTILGDVAQATGPVVYRRWQELEPFLPDEADVTIEELRHAYRVPGEIMEFALPLLDLIAPDVERPLAYRQGAASRPSACRSPRVTCSSQRCGRPRSSTGCSP